MSVSDGDVYMHPIQRPTGPYESAQEHPSAYQDMEAVEAGSHEENPPKYRVRQAISKLKVLECLHPEKTESTDKCKQ